MALSNRGAELTPREFEQMRHDKEMVELQAETQIKLKQLEVEVLKTDSRWNTLFILPREILKLPVRILFALAYVVSVIRKHEPSDRFWDWMK